jgi:membrane protein DedA with SNARE-associated domain
MAALALILITALSIWVAYYVGVRQGRATEKALALSVQRATPRIGRARHFLNELGAPPSGCPFKFSVNSPCSSR